MMYCKRCLAALPVTAEDFYPIGETGKKPPTLPYALPKQSRRCRRCFRKYDLGDASTYLQTLTLTPSQIAWKLLVTTLVGLGVAMVIATFQMANASGH